MAVTFGGVFLRANDPKALYAWYVEHLGLKQQYGAFAFDAPKGPLMLSFFKREDEYFPSAQPAMLNFQVDDLDALLEKLMAEGVAVDAKRDEAEYGKFGWIMDPEGNRVELWQPMGE
jgi:predicted enzyme related to lactoylglutathione lyase